MHLNGTRHCIPVGFILLLCASFAPRVSASAPTVHARAISGSIQIDGELNEPSWQQAGIIPDLTQQSPHPRAPTPYHTRILLLHDGHMLYIGVVATDPDPSQIATHTLVRDGSQDNDDYVGFVIDTFGTKRVAYVFQVNAAGAMADGLLSSEGIDYNWDGIWQARVRRNAHGWTAEIGIDTRSLQFGNKVQPWGFNVMRYVPRDLLTLDWSGTTLNSSVTNLQLEGTLTGVQHLKQGHGWDFRPYGLARYETGSGTTSHAGFDLKYNFNPSLAGLFTYHTDFANAEADQQQINTGRFPLFFPEKRQFFLQGANLFSFGYNLSGFFGFSPYYSRRIGLVNGEPVPLNEGVKLIGQSAAGSIALLDTQMAGTDVSSGTNLFVGRSTWNPDQHLQTGVLVTHGTPTGSGDNTFVGADALWSTATLDGGKNLNLSAWGGHSQGTLAAGNTNGYGVGIEYPNDLWYANAQINVFGDALDPALGFLQRPGTRQYAVEATYKPRPSADGPFGWVHQFFFSSHYNEVDGYSAQDGGKQSSEWWFAPDIFTQSGYEFQFGVFRDYDVPPQAFDIVPGITIPAGAYTWTATFTRFSTPYVYPVNFRISYRSGPYYSGRLQYPSANLNWTLPSGKLQISVSQDDLFGYLPQGDYYVRLSTLGATWSFTPDIYISEFAQYANNIPGVSINTRLRWIVGQASNIYLVWNHGLVTNTNGLGQPVVGQGNEIIFKVQWDFRN